MSIARAFTTRKAKQSVDLRDGASFPHRSNTTAKGMSIRNKISAPVELIHTTNMLSYNAPDLFPKTAQSATSSKSDDDSDSAPTTASTPPTSPDSPFPEKRETSPEPNHLSCYFTAPKSSIPPISSTPLTATPPLTEAPIIPQRAPSHTKKSYETLTRQRSASRLSEQSSRSISTKASFTFSRSSSASTSTSVTSASSHSSVLSHGPKPSTASISAPIPISSTTMVVPSSPPVAAYHKMEYSESHPFGHELAQVSELAEEYASSTKEDETQQKQQDKPMSAMEVEEQELLRCGLLKFSADDYLSEIRGLATTIFAEATRPMAAVWI